MIHVFEYIDMYMKWMTDIEAKKELDVFHIGQGTDSAICAVEGSAAKRVLAQALANKWEPETGLQGVRIQKSEVGGGGI